MTTNNHLAEETSPYLLQHAGNPVDWFPWGPEALQKARQENKPILLSIGYAACHWCHVMADESFEDEETARLMNQWFINIKVDREERPDLDKIYQTAHQLLTGRPGGWPLTVFLTPATQEPFYAGTYFPWEESFGRPAFKTVLTEIAHFYYQRQDAIGRITQAVSSALNTIAFAAAKDVVLNQEPLTKVREEFEKSFDFIHGGFGRAPKFPLTTHLESLLAHYHFSACQDLEALRMVKHSLTKMSQGGFCDQIGGGFFRYCVDANWMIPHFEKMLYDNAQLIALYSDFARIEQEPDFEKTVLAAITWVLREMRAPEGAFYSSLNADSEGVEGKYYIWDRKEIREILTHLEYSAIADYFGLTQRPNFEGQWHLYIHERDPGIQGEWLEPAKAKLLAAREKRVHPSCDKKILCSWNALMIKALLKAEQAFQSSWDETVVKKALDFIYENMWQEPHLFAVYAEGKAHVPGFLDDYVFLLDALWSFLQIHWRNDYFQWALALAEQLLARFYDSENGGFFYTANDHEKLIQRPKIFADEALPAANGVAMSVFIRLGYLLGEKKYLDAAEQTLQASWEQVRQHPSAHDSVLAGLRSYFNPPTLIILRGEAALIPEWQQEFNKHYLPNHACFAPLDHESLSESINKPVPDSGVIAYICEGSQCQLIISTLPKFVDYLTCVSVRS